MTTLAAIPDYTFLLAKHPARAIRTEAENKHYTSILYELDQRIEH